MEKLVQRRRGRKMWLAIVLMILNCSGYAQGAVYVNQYLKEVTSFNTSRNTLCVQSISETPKVALRLKLYVSSLNNNEQFLAGEVIIRPKLMAPVNSNHKITIIHLEEDTENTGFKQHALKVFLDGREMKFSPAEIYPTYRYNFHHIALLLRGTAHIYPCEEFSTTTIPPTTTTEMTTTTTTPSPPPSTKPAPVYAEEKREEEPEMRLEGVFRLEEENFDPNQAEDALEDGEGIDIEKDDEEKAWWDFIYVVGDFKGIPVLILLVILFVVGLGIGSVGTILCEQYCCSCQNEDDEESKLHDGNFGHRAVVYTDYHSHSYGPMHSTSLSTHIDKEAISPPISATTAYRSPHYRLSRDREWQLEQQPLRNSSDGTHPQRNSSDETLPLNTPLPQEHQSPHSRVSQDHYDPYKESSLDV
ncbi:hypothetical protein SK128_022211 [Halocaridina rubra]|uniref:Uncharacterized protein n=1 Tax=Halocaridina rubra TaxID=373956 RepID=A0AAN9FUC0_HALRR